MSNLKSLLTFICSLFIIFLSLFYACSESPVTAPVEDFAPSRFNWRTEDIIGNGFAGSWAQDTGKIFILNHWSHTLDIVSGGYSELHDIGDYYLTDIKGLSPNEIYFFGTDKETFYLTIIK